MKRPSLLLPFAAALLLSAALDARGGALEKLVMPGELIQGHARYEEQCGQCHDRTRRLPQESLCRVCHKEVDGDLRSRRGFHGRAGQGECRGCHTDHRGRGARIVPLDPEGFDHGKSDFPLTGGHAQTPCDSCHLPGKKYREAAADCLSCHRKDDRHKGTLGKGCSECHSTATWRGGRFDHATTRFPLTGRHATTLCATCHPDERYKATPRECLACHRINDKHDGRHGAECGKCHTTAGWRGARFEHKGKLFPSGERHRAAPCAACHREGVVGTKPATTCNGCHREDDLHRGKHGTDCAACHDGARSWRTPRFDHARQTRFPLQGAHGRASCESCHRGELYKEKLDRACYACHRADDRHAGSQGRECGSCHNAAGWRDKVRFDHDMSRLPLIGLHAAVACESCHRTARYGDTPRTCNQCHRRDDPHQGRLGEGCQQCHNPNGWKVWRFDHATQTRFPLKGRHAGLDCLACHREPEAKASAACVSCHRKDDRHLGRFGDRCEQCHSGESFTRIDWQRGRNKK